MKIGDRVEILYSNGASIDLGDTGEIINLPQRMHNVYTVAMMSGTRKGVHYVFKEEHMRLINKDWDS